MSGGHFEYMCFKISRFADELELEITSNDDKSLDSYGDIRGYNYEKETIEVLKKSQKVIEMAGKLAREIEWLYSGDHGEETAIKLLNDIMKNKKDQ